ncbi:hypothetical protein H0H92_008809 [Tricholoma furcatifolium]|nr:hypothetical protein H0H92_008809 [Tricholoma furcatifolium]
MKLQVRIFHLFSIAYGVVGRPADALATDDSASTDVVKAETPGPSGSSVAKSSAVNVYGGETICAKEIIAGPQNQSLATPTLIARFMRPATQNEKRDSVDAHVIKKKFDQPFATAPRKA